MPITFGPRAVWPRGLCIGIGLLAVLLLVIAACITPLATRRFAESYTSSSVLATTTRVQPFSTCDNTFSVFAKNADEFCNPSVDYNLVSTNADCKTYKNFIRSIQAFYIFTLLAVIAAIVLAVLNAFGVINSLFMSIAIGVALVCSLIGLAVGFAIYTKKFDSCFVESWKNRGDFNMGESAGLMTAAFLLLLCLLIASCIMEKGPHDGGQQQPKQQYLAPAPAPVVVQQSVIQQVKSEAFDL